MKPACIFRVCFAVVLLAAFAAAAACEVVLVENGRAACTIVTGEDDGLSLSHSLLRRDTTIRIPSRALELAADDLAESLNYMGWIGDPRAVVPVVKEAGEARTRYRVLLGAAAIEEYGLHEEAAELSYPGYIYRTVGRDLLIFGATSKGTANGVYGFLQDELGVRWFGPQELFTVMPERLERIAVSGLDERVEPSFTGRYSGTWGSDWGRRMRIAEAGDIRRRALEPFSAASHHLHWVIPYARYGETNREYFRRGGHPPHINPCWTNPDVIEIAAEAAKDAFRSGGEYLHSFSLGALDSAAYCGCEDCVALQPDRIETRASGAMNPKVASDMYFHFVNEVARRVAEEFPDRYLGIIAYRDVTAPPLGEIEDNVFVMVVIDPSEHYDLEVKERDESLLREWEEKGITLGIYYYPGLAKLVPAYWPRHLSRVLKELHGRGYRGLFNESNVGWPWAGPMQYAQARLWWDAGLDIDELLEEYFEKLYGPAAPYVAGMYDLFEEIHMRPRPGGFFSEHYSFRQFRPYTGEDLERIRGLIASANDALERLGYDDWAGSTNLEERRLAYVVNGLDLFLDMLEGTVLARELEGMDAAKDDVGVLGVLGRINRVNGLIDRHERVYRTSIIMDPHMPNRYRRDTCTVTRVQWKRYLSSSVLTALAGVHPARELLDERVRAMLDECVDEFTADPVNRASFLVKAGEAQLGENLASNPGFEDVDQQGRPEGWSRTPDRDLTQDCVIDTVEWPRFSEILGARSGRMKGLTRTSYYLKNVDGVMPGEPYMIEADAKLVLPEPRNPNVSMQVTWRGREGWIRGEHRYNASLHQINEWETMRIVAVAPPGADRAAVFLQAGRLADGEEALFDNVSVRRIARE